MHVRDFSGDNVFLESFALQKRRGCHGKCVFGMVAPEEKADEFLSRVGRSLCVTLSEDDDLPVFCGIITKATCEKSRSRTCVVVEACSESFLLDEKPQKRIFQDPEKKFGDIFRDLKIEGCSLRPDDEIKNAVCEPVILQNDETDFHFIRRLAAQKGRSLWIMDTNEGRPAIRIATAAAGETRNIEDAAIFRQTESRVRNGARHVSLQTRKFVDIGRLVTLCGENTRYLVTSLRSELYHGDDMFSYKLQEYNPNSVGEPGQEGCNLLLRARVSDNKDPENMGRVRVHFLDVEDNTPENRRVWLPFSPGYAGKASGIVFIPDKGDLVEVLFLDDRPFICAASRENALLEECRNVSDKYLGNNSGRRIFWKEKSLELHSAENRIYMDDKKIELVNGENMIRMDEKGIFLKTPANSIQLTDKELRNESTGKIVQKSQDDCEISSNAETSIAGTRMVKISGQKINLC